MIQIDKVNLATAIPTNLGLLLRASRADGVLAITEDIYDKVQNKSQEDINSDLYKKVANAGSVGSFSALTDAEIYEAIGKTFPADPVAKKYAAYITLGSSSDINEFYAASINTIETTKGSFTQIPTHGETLDLSNGDTAYLYVHTSINDKLVRQSSVGGSDGDQVVYYDITSDTGTSLGDSAVLESPQSVGSYWRYTIAPTTAGVNSAVIKLGITTGCRVDTLFAGLY